MTLIIRNIQESDLPDIARIHVDTWKAAYIGQLSQSFLDQMNVADRLEIWRTNFQKFQHDAQRGTLIAHCQDQPAGFLSYGPTRDSHIDADCEIYAVYVLPAFWGKGIGHSLLKHALDIFRRKGHKKTYLWVLDTNQRAKDAYARWSATIGAQEKTIMIGDQNVREVSAHFSIGE